MKPGRVPIYCRQGSTFERTIRVTTLDLSGYELRMQVRYKKAPYPLLIELSTDEGGLTLVTTSTGIGEAAVYTNFITLEIDDDVVQGFPAKVFDYDIEMIAPVSLKNYPLLEGPFVVEKDTTKPRVVS